MRSGMLTLILTGLFLCSCDEGFGQRIVHKWDIAAQSVAELSDKIAEEHGLTQLKIRKDFVMGTGCVADSWVCIWAPNFKGSQKLTLEEVRPMAQAIAQKLAHHLFTDPVFVEYWEDRNTGARKGELSINDIGYKLTFWDEEVNRPAPPYIAQVRFIEGELRYYTADPETGALKEPIVEPFQYHEAEKESATGG